MKRLPARDPDTVNMPDPAPDAVDAAQDAIRQSSIMPVGHSGLAVDPAGVADIIGYRGPTIDWNAEAPADSGGAVADVLVPAAVESAPVDLNDIPIPSTNLDAVPSLSDLFASPTKSASNSFAVLFATNTSADDAEDLINDVNAGASSTGPAILASLTNLATNSFGSLLADSFPNGAAAAPASQGNLGYGLAHTDFDVAAPTGVGAATTVGSFAVAEPAHAPASAASLANPPADSFAAPITDSAVGSNGATAAQVQQALDESGLNVIGTGIKVGVLSDSFNDLGGAAADEADGTLPSAANIDVIKDLGSGGTDEGRAMMQIIHDIAPGASLAFYTAYDSEQDFANGILALAAAGSKVIVDDVSYSDEPFFQSGLVAQAIQTVEAEGVTYVTAAGNEASNGYQAAWSPISGTYDGKTLTDAESFGGSLVQTVTINTEGTGDDVPLVLEWNQAFGAATSDLELLVFNSKGQLVGTATNASDGEPTNPWVEYDFSKSGTYHVAIENLSGPDPGLIKEITEGDGLPATISGANVGTVVGHAMTPGAISAGAVSTADTPAFGFTPVSESFSSSGAGTELLFANNGTALSSPDQLSPVAVSGVDDIQTTVSGGLSDFYGTSAASASLAGAAALILSANPNLTPAEVEQLMEETALPMANAAVSGAGLVQLDPAVEDVESGIFASAIPTLTITSTGGVTNQAMQTIAGTIDAADTGLTVSIYDGTTLLGTATPSANGNWSKLVTLLSTQGAQAITAQATDAAGNVGTSSAVTYTLDTVPPVLAITSAGTLTNQTTHTISGTIDAADAGLTVSIFDGATLLGTVTPAANGAWSKAVTLLSAQGTQAITAQATDAAGNVGTSSPVTDTLDTTPPTLAIPSAGVLSNQTVETISGTIDAADAGLTVSIYDDTTLLGTVTPAANGTWSKSVSLLSTQGAQSITAQATDAAGNIGTSSSVTYTLDTIAPTLAITGTGHLTNQTTQTISGTIDAGDAGLAVSIYDGTTHVGTATASANGIWSEQVTLLPAQGAQAITAQATDAAGNIGISSFVTYTLDTMAPTLAITSTGGLTSQTTQTISGTIDTADANLTVSIYDGTTPVGTATPSANGNWSEQVTLLAALGAQAITAQAIDAAGNVGASSSVTYALLHLTNGSASLTESGNAYFVSDGGAPVALQFAGTQILTTNQWVPIGIEWAGSGYEVAWKYTGADQYVIWNADGNGNYTSTALGPVSGTSTGLEALEPSFNADLNGDGHIGVPPAAAATVAAGASLDIAAPSNQTVTFTAGTGSLVLNDPEGFTGQIAAFTGTAPDAAHSDTIDLIGINYDSSQFSESYNASTGLLTVSDGSNTASFTFDNFNATLDFASDGNGGTLITDPPATGSADGSSASVPVKWGMKFGDDKINFDVVQSDSQSNGVVAPDGQKTAAVLGGSAHDSFVFRPNLGVEATANLNSHDDAHALANQPNTQLAQQLAALVTPDPHAAAMFEFFHNDMLAPTGITSAQIHQLVQSGHLLH
jgi:tryptophan-rich protein/subtilase family protein/Big-like domain-containing protein